MLALPAGKSDLQGQKGKQERDRGKPLAGKSTLQRLERTTDGVDRYKKIRCDSEAINRLLVDVFVEAHPEPPEEIILAIDATDAPFDEQQEGRFFHGYYRLDVAKNGDTARKNACAPSWPGPSVSREPDLR